MSDNATTNDREESSGEGMQQGLNAAAEGKTEETPTNREQEPTDNEGEVETDEPNQDVETSSDKSSDDEDEIPIIEKNNGEVVGRKSAKRAFAREINDATFQFRESDEERSPRYALLPTGEKANRVFVAGTITEVEDVGTDGEYLRARVVDPTGTVYVYAGEYQQSAAGFLRNAEPPLFAAVTAKFKKVFETDNGDKRVSLRPEGIFQVEESERDNWVGETAEQTLERIKSFDPKSHYGELVEERYETDVEEYTDAVVKAAHDISPQTDEDDNAESDAD